MPPLQATIASGLAGYELRSSLSRSNVRRVGDAGSREGSRMHVPCPVPLQSPWSPAGYQVVEMSGAGPPVVGLAPDSGNPPVVRPALPPSSPVGYTVVVTEKPPAGRAPLVKSTAVRSRSRK